VKTTAKFRFALRFAFILFLVGSVTWVGLWLRINSFIAGFVYLLPVLLISFWWGFREATVASIGSVLCLDYFFTEPRFTLYMADRHDWVAICAFEIVAIVVSRLAVQVKAQADNAQEQRMRFERLYRISKEALLFDQPQESGLQLVQITREVLNADGVALWDANAIKTFMSGEIDIELDGLRSWYELSHGETLTEGPPWKRIVSLGAKPLGVLCIAAKDIDAPTLDAVASLAAISLERTRAFEEKSSAEAARQSEQLRSAVLDGLAHAFKTPLTTIRSASSGLLEIEKLEGEQRELVGIIDQEAERLTDLTTRLLTTAKLDSARLKIHREQVGLTEILEKCGDDCSVDLVGHILSCEDVSATTHVWADPLLVKLALNQIVDNAVKYGTPGARISVSVRDTDAETVIAIRNEGSFIRSEDLQRIFTRFYRTSGSEHRASGTGIGLSVTKRIVEAHGGSVWAESSLDEGTTFFFSLPHGPTEP
jgi:two-component system sensor histidine kinase KdpD